MGYEVRITRGSTSEGETIAIDEAEWDALIDADPELRRQSGLSTENPRTGETIAMGGEFLIWTGHSTFEEVPFRLSRGQAYCGAGDQFDEVLAKLKSLAESLDAQVVGDEGETY